MKVTARRNGFVRRRQTVLNAESSRVIVRPYGAGDGARVRSLIERVAKLSDAEVKDMLEIILRDFSERHRYLGEALERNFEHAAAHSPQSASFSPERRLLLGAYFTAE